MRERSRRITSARRRRGRPWSAIVESDQPLVHRDALHAAAIVGMTAASLVAVAVLFVAVRWLMG